MEFTDYYTVLGVAPDASKDDIKRAFKVLARKYHPDVSTEDDAQAKFQAVSEAYEILKDSEKRAEYDDLRNFVQHQGAGGRQPGGEGFDINDLRGDARFEDILSSIFGQRGFDADFGQRPFGGAGRFSGGQGFARPGRDLHYTLQLRLEEAHQGGEKQLRLQSQTGEKSIKVRIPAGITSGKELRLRGQGEPGSRPDSAGDLYLQIELLPDPRFQLDGQDIIHVASLAPWDAALGCQLAVPTLAGLVNLKVPANSQNGSKLRLKGKGLTANDDQIVVLNFVNPPVDSTEDRAAFETLQRHFKDFTPKGKSG